MVQEEERQWECREIAQSRILATVQSPTEPEEATTLTYLADRNKRSQGETVRDSSGRCRVHGAKPFFPATQSQVVFFSSEL